jgi:hypothetical protein
MTIKPYYYDLLSEGIYTVGIVLFCNSNIVLQDYIFDNIIIFSLLLKTIQNLQQPNLDKLCVLGTWAGFAWFVSVKSLTNIVFSFAPDIVAIFYITTKLYVYMWLTSKDFIYIYDKYAKPMYMKHTKAVDDILEKLYNLKSTIASDSVKLHDNANKFKKYFINMFKKSKQEAKTQKDI